MEGIEKIQYADFTKLDLRVGEIELVEEIEGADKLYKVSINLGKEKRIVCAGLKEYYSKDELESKRIILLYNLQPRMMRGIESNGMMLAAVTEDDKTVALLTPDKDIELGSKVF
ncbi:MAG: hypothetical protein PHX15_02440 [Candidatus Nanoarchaeia archaeon]|nr:hypothetical protein [Candidatus Nanoarchaeia archaeon]